MLKGLQGNDSLDGGRGSDVLVGGLGRDTFLFTAGLEGTTIDTIADFSPGDTISLASPIFQLAPGGLTSTAFCFAATAQDADDRILYDPATGLLAYDADGSGAGAAIAFARLSAGLSLTAADFVVA